MTTAWALRHDPADQLSELEETLGGVSQKKESWHYDRAGNLASTVNVPAGQTGVLQMRTHIGRNQLTQLGGTGKTLVEGSTNEAATVKVNGQPAQVTKLGPSGPWRFQKEMDFPSGTTSITVEAKDGANNVRTNTYNVNVAASGAQTLEYDTNGNLLAVKDAGNVVLRSFEWDASNRLLAIQIPARSPRAQSGRSSSTTEPDGGSASSTRSTTARLGRPRAIGITCGTVSNWPRNAMPPAVTYW